ncbi:GxxExxY protein [Arachidicoccus ginsenosidimutans]|uniref:GxxExxY protein n=1 Tax=Arachidicoccus sp. BS20 TaxID=1850526 RepID=UPI0007F08424|nr:GxxExxY protein [Arachidicoccus sp. BS20]ANI88109.1 GxxExxY protein [Arachidicoccus sp. BS20]
MHKEEKEHIEWLGKQIVDIAYHLHKALGPGLLEKVYEACFCYELGKRSIPFVTQKRVAIVYDNIEFDEALRLDILVDDRVIIELKAQENFHPVWEAQLLSYLRLSNKHLGYIINFTVPLIKDGIKRMILS